MNLKSLFVGFIFLLLGLLIVYYEYNERRKTKDYRANFFHSPKGYLAGFSSIIFGIYLIFQSFNFLIFK